MEPWGFPAGYILLPTDLFQNTRDEAELAGALAHSIAHIALRHANVQRGQGTSTVPLIFLGFWTGYGVPESRARNRGSPMSWARNHRAQELEADALGVRLMSAAGYNPAAYVGYIERRHPEAEEGNIARASSIFPPKAERLAALEAAIAELPARTPARTNDEPAADFPAIREALLAAVPRTQPRPRPTLRRTGEN